MSIHITTEDFINRAKIIHGDRYRYEFTVYKRAHEKVFIFCKTHGFFSQKASDHTHNKCGCPLCGGSHQLSTDLFIARSVEKHKGKYSYENVNYINAHTHVSITCRLHGDFLQAPNHHLKGAGCPGCRISGFNKEKPASLYVLRSSCGRYMKIGITQNYKNRKYNLKLSTPFSFECIELIEGQGDYIADLEKELLSCYNQAEFTETFDGYTEWRLFDDSIRHKLLTSKIQG